MSINQGSAWTDRESQTQRIVGERLTLISSPPQPEAPGPPLSARSVPHGQFGACAGWKQVRPRQTAVKSARVMLAASSRRPVGRSAVVQAVGCTTASASRDARTLTYESRLVDNRLSGDHDVVAISPHCPVVDATAGNENQHGLTASGEQFLNG